MYFQRKIFGLAEVCRKTELQLTGDDKLRLHLKVRASRHTQEMSVFSVRLAPPAFGDVAGDGHACAT